MNSRGSQTINWKRYAEPAIRSEFAPGSVIVDVGCGDGEELQQLARRGFTAIGLDVDPQALDACRRRQLPVVLAQAEHMPLRSASCGGVVCSVAVPYTDESKVLAEVGRILQPGARGYFSYHGLGYFLVYICKGPTLAMRLYGIRSVLNAWFYRWTGRRLHGFWGDTLYQSRSRLRWYYRRDQLRLIQDRRGRRFLGFTVFAYHTIERL